MDDVWFWRLVFSRTASSTEGCWLAQTTKHGKKCCRCREWVACPLWRTRMQLPTLTTTKLGSLVLKRMVCGGKIEVGIGLWWDFNQEIQCDGKQADDIGQVLLQHNGSVEKEIEGKYWGKIYLHEENWRPERSLAWPEFLTAIFDSTWSVSVVLQLSWHDFEKVHAWSVSSSKERNGAKRVFDYAFNDDDCRRPNEWLVVWLMWDKFDCGPRICATD